MSKKFFKKNKRGWVKIVEAFIAIMLVAIVLLTALNEREGVFGEGGRENLYKENYETQISILKKIQLNETLRNEVLGISKEELPVNWSEMPLGIKNKVNDEKPLYLNCTTKICSLGGRCELEQDIREEVFAENLGIFTNSSTYNPRKLKLFCWER